MSQSRETGSHESAGVWRRLSDRPLFGPVAFLVAVLVVVFFGLVALPPAESSSPVAGVAVIVVLAVAFVVIVLGCVLRLSGVDRAAGVIAGHLASDADQRRLLTRWLERARWARFVGGLSGVIVSVIGNAHTGRGAGDLVLFGTGGIAIGAMLAELHHVRPRRGPRTARLDIRSVRSYSMSQDTRRMIVVAAAAIVLCAVGLVARHGSTPLLSGAIALAALALTRLAQQRVASRPRPAVPAKLIRADDLARELAIGRGLARPGTYFALALVAHGCHALGPTTTRIGTIGSLAGAVAWIYAVVLWWHNRRLGLDFLLTESHEPVLA